MSQYLPVCVFKRLTQNEIDGLDVNTIRKDSSQLHNLRNGYSSAPRKSEIKENILTDYWIKNANKPSISVVGVKKFLPILGNKSKHVLHYRNLQLSLDLRMKLTKINRLLVFK